MFLRPFTRYYCLDQSSRRMGQTIYECATPSLTNLFDLQGNEPVINVDLAANLHHFGNVLVVEPEELLTAVFLLSIIQGNLDHLALLQLHLSCATLSKHFQGIFHFFGLTDMQNVPKY